MPPKEFHTGIYASEALLGLRGAWAAPIIGPLESDAEEWLKHRDAEEWLKHRDAEEWLKHRDAGEWLKNQQQEN